MPVKSIAELKKKFERGDQPTAEDFVDLIDSFLHAGLGNFPDPLPAVSGKNLKDIVETLPNPLPALDGRNLTNIQPSEWITVLTAPSFADATSFVLLGDLTHEFPVGRRLRLKINGTYHITEVVSSSVAGGNPPITTVVVLNPMPSSALTEVAVALLRPANAGGTMPPGEFTTGDAKLTFKTVADPGWILVDDGSIGSADSGATTRANADTEALFTLFWNNMSETWCPVQDSDGNPVARGASAAADFAANRRLLIPRSLGRAIAIAGAGAGLTPRALGEYLGEEMHELTGAETGPHVHTMQSAGTHTHNLVMSMGSGTGEVVTRSVDVTPSPMGGFVSSAGAHTHTIDSAGDGQPHNNMQPSFFMNVMIKL